MTRILLIIASLMVSFAFADEPLWTPQQRTEQRVAVINGTVLRVVKRRTFNQYADLMSAEIRIARVLKHSDSLPEKVVTVFYESSPGNGKRCPTYAKLVSDQTSTFYLSYHDSLTGKKDFIIEMGGDVQSEK